MGNLPLEALTQESLEELDWGSFDSEESYLQVSPDLTVPEVCKKALQNCQKSELVPHLMSQAIQNWEKPFLSAVLMKLLKKFCEFVFSEGIPYQFLFQDLSQNQEGVADTTFHRLVPVVFYFKDLSKTIYVSIPQTPVYEQQKEEVTLIDAIKKNFQEVNDHVLRKNERVHLLDQNSKPIGITEIIDHYNQKTEDVLIDPFSRQSKQVSVMKVWVQTVECDMASSMSKFIKELLELSSTTEIEGNELKLQASVELLITLLSSQLYYMNKPTGRIDYQCFKPSPVLHILMTQPIETSQLFTKQLLEIVTKYYQLPRPSSGLFSFFYSKLSMKLEETKHLLGKQALSLCLVLQSYSLTQNFYVKKWEYNWQEVLKLIVEHIHETQFVLLLYYLLNRNKSFHSYLVSLSEPETFIEPLAGYLYSDSKDSFKTHLVLVVILMLTQDKLFMKFICNDVHLTKVTWLQDYHIESISLGSLLFLGVLKLFRENIKGPREEYKHVIASGSLFNLAEQCNNLHELTSLEFASLVKALFSKYKKVSTAQKPTQEIQATVELINLLTDIICRLLQHTYQYNTSFLYVLIHHAELWEELSNSSLKTPNVEVIYSLVRYLVEHVDRDNLLTSIMELTKRYNLEGEVEMEAFGKAMSFEFEEDLDLWEQFSVPYLWAEVSSKDFVLIKKNRIMLFKT